MAVHARRNDQWIVEENFDVQVIHPVIVGTRLRHSREDDIMCPVAQSGELEARRRHNVRAHDDARIFHGKSFDHQRDDDASHQFRISNR